MIELIIENCLMANISSTNLTSFFSLELGFPSFHKFCSLRCTVFRLLQLE